MSQPHRALLAALVATAVVATAAMCGVGWVLLNQQREIDERRALAQVESRADALAAGIRGHLADAGERLSAWLSDPRSAAPIPNAVVVSIDSHVVQTSPNAALPFVPVVEADLAGPQFAAAEILELREHRSADAAEQYRVLAKNRDPHVRAGALYRLGRGLRSAGDSAAAVRVADDLISMGDVRVGDVPAELAGLVAKRAALRAAGELAGAARVEAIIQQGLDGGRWLVARGDAEAYRDEVSSSPRGDNWNLADVVTETWRDADGQLPARGQRTFVENDRPAVVLWRTSGTRTSLLVAFVDAFFAPVLPADVAWRLLDDDGRVLGGTAEPFSAAAARVINGEYPWRIEVRPSARPPAGGNRAAILVMLVITVAFTWGTAYFMARAIRRESAVARLQSDFVAAVSHEFRSPLTTVRQLTELLETDRLPNEARRSQYYRMLTAEAARLQRLVETLLNFGRMEAGTVRYQLANLDAAVLVHSVVGDLGPQARSSGIRIDTDGDEAGVVVRGDPAALAMALRNLIDNAIKYSPGQSVVRVSWSVDNGRVAIRVRDSGLGIPPAEQKRVFQKFVRGEAAMSTNVSGTGVGLAMVQQIVLGHGGEIQLESLVGQGSTFTVFLPSATGSPVTVGAST